MQIIEPELVAAAIRRQLQLEGMPLDVEQVNIEPK
jgi:hypothetical protein